MLLPLISFPGIKPCTDLAAILCLLILSLSRGLCEDMSMVTFLNEGSATSRSYLKYLGKVPDLKEMTLCFRVHLLQNRDKTLALSYSQLGTDDNSLVIGFNSKKGEMILSCCNHSWDVKLNIELRMWTSICVALAPEGRKRIVVQDDDIMAGVDDDSFTEHSEALVVQGGGNLFLGKGLRGSLIDLRLYNDILSMSDLKQYTNCESIAHISEPLIDFTNMTEHFEITNADISDMEETYLCQESQPFDFVFTEHRSFQESEMLCKTLGGSITVPKDREENKRFLTIAASSVDRCSNGVWLGVKGNMDNKYERHWYNVNSNDEIQYTNFKTEQELLIEEPEACGALKISQDTDMVQGDWMAQSCSLENCVFCHFEKLPFLRIRGLCHKSEFDNEYFIVDENSTVKFMGVYNSKIVRHLPSQNNSHFGDFGYWEMSRNDMPWVNATLPLKNPTHYPTGLQNWTVNRDVCGKNEVELRLTSCKNQFSCNDGTCIPIKERCNMEVNCLDGSDEVNCKLLVLHNGYDYKTPPPRRDRTSPLNVSLHITMLSVRAFDLTGFNFVCEIDIRLTWNDDRVKFYHLHEEESLNIIHVSDQKPWMPTMEYLGDAFTTSDVEERRSSLVARRVMKPLPDDDQNLMEDEIFTGRHNPLVLMKRLTVTTSCVFDLITFPFDTQTCKLAIVLSGVTKNYLQLVPEGRGVTYLGSRKLLEYYLSEEEITPHNEGNYSGQAVKLTFKNQSTFYVTSTYIPTFIIVAIGYIVFFFPIEDFNERIMVALTALLVEAAFFTQMSASVPKTAYLKLVDIWFVYCIISLFLVVVTVAFINWCKKCAPACLLRVDRYAPQSEKVLQIRRTALASKLNLLCRIVCPILTALFFIVYLTMAALIDISKLPIELPY